MGKNLATAIAALALAAPVSVVMTATAAEARGTYFSSCDALTHHWPNGVAKSRRAAMKQVRQGNSRPAFGPRARSTYWTNESRLDRDNDGTACEN